ncbi:MAG: nucleotidyltransferase domain-containing protein, partial [Bacillota bacterium]
MGPRRSSPEWLNRVKDHLDDREDVLLAFLFGSFSAGKEHQGSDVDIAVYLESPYTTGDVESLSSRLEDMCQREVGLLVLNDAPP